MLRRCPVMSGYEAWLIADAAVAGERHEVEIRRTGIGDQRSEVGVAGDVPVFAWRLSRKASAP